MSIDCLRILWPFCFFCYSDTGSALPKPTLFSVTLDVGVQQIEDDPWSVRTSPHGSAHVMWFHHRVKVYHLHAFCLAQVELGLAHHFLRSAAAAHIEAHTRRERERERERGTIQTTPQRMETYTHKVVKMPVLASILVNTVGYVLS